MAFDIAAIQDLYGANDDYHAGNDVYALRHVNGRPDALTAIWDTGGVDTIVYGGRYAATIDLRDATLENAPGGGGFVSYARGAPSSHLDHWNAFTIANGVVIENAKGGFSHDRIIGNQADNTLFGFAGNDLLIGSLGDDLLHGGGGRDRLIGGSGDDLLRGAGGRDRLIGGNGDDIFDFNAISHSRPRAPDFITQFDRHVDLIDLSNIDARSGITGNNKFKWIGKQDFHEKCGELHYKDLGSKVLVEGDINGDGRADFPLKVNVGAIGSNDFIL